MSLMSRVGWMDLGGTREDLVPANWRLEVGGSYRQARRHKCIGGHVSLAMFLTLERSQRTCTSTQMKGRISAP